MTPTKAEISSEVGVAELVQVVVTLGDNRRLKDRVLFNSCGNGGDIHWRESSSYFTVLLGTD